MIGFKDFFGLPSVHGTIDVMQVHIYKPKSPYVGDYYFFKLKANNMQFQAIVDLKKFHDTFVGMLGSMNDAWIFQFSSLYHKVMNGELFHFNYGLEDVKPYLIRDKGYYFLPWLMIPCTQLANYHHIVLEALIYNKQLCQTRNVVENSFGILKKSFRKLLLKSNLNILFLLVVCLLHSLQHDFGWEGPRYRDFDDLVGVRD
jgi:hypothetical protein